MSTNGFLILDTGTGSPSLASDEEAEGAQSPFVILHSNNEAERRGRSERQRPARGGGPSPVRHPCRSGDDSTGGPQPQRPFGLSSSLFEQDPDSQRADTILHSGALPFGGLVGVGGPGAAGLDAEEIDAAMAEAASLMPGTDHSTTPSIAPRAAQSTLVPIRWSRGGAGSTSGGGAPSTSSVWAAVEPMSPPEPPRPPSSVAPELRDQGGDSVAGAGAGTAIATVQVREGAAADGGGGGNTRSSSADPDRGRRQGRRSRDGEGCVAEAPGAADADDEGDGGAELGASMASATGLLADLDEGAFKSIPPALLHLLQQLEEERDELAGRLLESDAELSSLRSSYQQLSQSHASSQSWLNQLLAQQLEAHERRQQRRRSRSRRQPTAGGGVGGEDEPDGHSRGRSVTARGERPAEIAQIGHEGDNTNGGDPGTAAAVAAAAVETAVAAAPAAPEVDGQGGLGFVGQEQSGEADWLPGRSDQEGTTGEALMETGASWDPEVVEGSEEGEEAAHPEEVTWQVEVADTEEAAAAAAAASPQVRQLQQDIAAALGSLLPDGPELVQQQQSGAAAATIDDDCAAVDTEAGSAAPDAVVAASGDVTEGLAAQHGRRCSVPAGSSRSDPVAETAGAAHQDKGTDAGADEAATSEFCGCETAAASRADGIGAATGNVLGGLGAAREDPRARSGGSSSNDDSLGTSINEGGADDAKQAEVGHVPGVAPTAASSSDELMFREGEAAPHAKHPAARAACHGLARTLSAVVEAENEGDEQEAAPAAAPAERGLRRRHQAQPPPLQQGCSEQRRQQTAPATAPEGGVEEPHRRQSDEAAAARAATTRKQRPLNRGTRAAGTPPPESPVPVGAIALLVFLSLLAVVLLGTAAGAVWLRMSMPRAAVAADSGRGLQTAPQQVPPAPEELSASFAAAAAAAATARLGGDNAAATAEADDAGGVPSAERARDAVGGGAPQLGDGDVEDGNPSHSDMDAEGDDTDLDPFLGTVMFIFRPGEAASGSEEAVGSEEAGGVTAVSDQFDGAEAEAEAAAAYTATAVRSDGVAAAAASDVIMEYSSSSSGATGITDTLGGSTVAKAAAASAAAELGGFGKGVGWAGKDSGSSCTERGPEAGAGAAEATVAPPPPSYVFAAMTGPQGPPPPQPACAALRGLSEALCYEDLSRTKGDLDPASARRPGGGRGNRHRNARKARGDDGRAADDGGDALLSTSNPEAVCQAVAAARAVAPAALQPRGAAVRGAMKDVEQRWRRLVQDVQERGEGRGGGAPSSGQHGKPRRGKGSGRSLDEPPEGTDAKSHIIASQVVCSWVSSQWLPRLQPLMRSVADDEELPESMLAAHKVVALAARLCSETGYDLANLTAPLRWRLDAALEVMADVAVVHADRSYQGGAAAVEAELAEAGRCLGWTAARAAEAAEAAECRSRCSPKTRLLGALRSLGVPTALLERDLKLDWLPLDLDLDLDPTHWDLDLDFLKLKKWVSAGTPLMEWLHAAAAAAAEAGPGAAGAAWEPLVQTLRGAAVSAAATGDRAARAAAKAAAAAFDSVSDFAESMADAAQDVFGDWGGLSGAAAAAGSLRSVERVRASMARAAEQAGRDIRRAAAAAAAAAASGVGSRGADGAAWVSSWARPGSASSASSSSTSSSSSSSSSSRTSSSFASSSTSSSFSSPPSGSNLLQALMSALRQAYRQQWSALGCGCGAGAGAGNGTSAAAVGKVCVSGLEELLRATRDAATAAAAQKAGRGGDGDDDDAWVDGHGGTERRRESDRRCQSKNASRSEGKCDANEKGGSGDRERINRRKRDIQHHGSEDRAWAGLAAAVRRFQADVADLESAVSAVRERCRGAVRGIEEYRRLLQQQQQQQQQHEF